MSRSRKDRLNWHRFHDAEDNLSTYEKDKLAAMKYAGYRHGNHRKMWATLKVKMRRSSKRKEKREFENNLDELIDE